MKKIISLIIIILVVGGGIFFYSKKNVLQPEHNVVACDMSALMCPDGSSVVRSGPKCEFSACANKEYFVGTLSQTIDGFRLLMETPVKGGGYENTYVMPLEIKVSNALRTLVGKNVKAYGTFLKSNVLIVDHLEEIEGIAGDSERGTAKVGESKYINGVTVTVNKVVQDSRCPTDVQCIRAGDTTVQVTLKSDTDRLTLEITSGKPAVPFDSYIVSLEGVTPSKVSTKTIASNSYEFSFKVTENKQ